MYQEIKLILERYSSMLSLWNESRLAINNYVTLLEASVRQELAEELESLKRLFNESDNKSPETIQAKFKELCRLRQVRNKGTCLSFTSRPEGDCNEMYWEIAKIIVKPKTLTDMMEVLLPDVKRAITLNTDKLLPEKSELEQHRQRLVDRVVVDVYESDLKGTLSDDLSLEKPSVLTGFVIDNDRIFDLKQMQDLPFVLQKKLYDKLSNDQYHTFKKKLYSHNKELEQLQTNIQLFNKDGAVLVSEAFRKLISHLVSSGTQFTGNVYASNKAVFACAEFRQYLDMFSDEMRKEIEALQSDGITLQATLANLEKEGSSCVETASANLKKILNGKEHAHIMQYHPALTVQQMKNIIASYGSGNPLPIIGFGNTTELPLQLKTSLLSKVKIGTVEGYLDFLIALPEAEYADFFEHVKIECYPRLPNNLDKMLEMLTDSQVQAFFSVISQHPEKFGGIGAIFKLGFNSINEPARLKAILELLPKSDLLNHVTKSDNRGYTLLHTLAKRNTAVLKAILEVLPESDRLECIKIKAGSGDTVLHDVAISKDPAMLQSILDLIPQTSRLEAVNIKDNKENTVLFHAAVEKNPAMLQAVFATTPEVKAELIERMRKDSFLSLLPDDMVKEMVLTSFVNDFENLVKVLKNLPQEKQIIFIEMLGIEKIMSLFYNGNGVYKDFNYVDFKFVIKQLSIDNQMSFMAMFSNEDISDYNHQPIYKHGDLLKILTKDKQKLLNKMISFKKNHYDILCIDLLLQPEDQRLLFIQFAGKDRLRVHSCDKLCQLLGALPEDKRIPFIYWYASNNNSSNDDTIASCLDNDKELEKMIALLPKGKERDRIGSVLRDEIRNNKLSYICQLIDLEIIRLQQPTKNPFLFSPEQKIDAFSKLKNLFRENMNNHEVKIDDIIVNWYKKNSDIINEARNPSPFLFFQKDKTSESVKFVNRLFNNCGVELDPEFTNKLGSK